MFLGNGVVPLEGVDLREVDPGRYRPKEEVDEWLTRDPLPRLAEHLPADVVERIAADVAREVDEALAAAEAAPAPDPSSLGSATK